VKVPDDREYETIGGFVTDQLDRLPEVDDEVEIEQGTLRVERVDGARVDRVRYLPRPPAADDDDENSDVESSEQASDTSKSARDEEVTE